MHGLNIVIFKTIESTYYYWEGLKLNRKLDRNNRLEI